MHDPRQGRIHKSRPFGEGPGGARRSSPTRSARDSSDRGGLIVNGNTGNTGIAFAIVANALGMKTVIVIPETQSQEKKDTLRSLGASLIEVPAVPYPQPQ